MADYREVANENQCIFNNPRQKTWCVQRKTDYGWKIELITNCFDEGKSKVKELLGAGGMYTSLDRVMMSELVPIDIVITPNV